MNTMRESNGFEFFRRPKVRRRIAAATGGTAVVGALACSGPVLSTPEPIPSNVIQVETPTCDLVVHHIKGKKYLFNLTVTNPSDLDLTPATIDFGNGVKRRTPLDADVTYPYPEAGHWRPEASFNVVVPKDTIYSLESYQISCGNEDLYVG